MFVVFHLLFSVIFPFVVLDLQLWKWLDCFLFEFFYRIFIKESAISFLSILPQALYHFPWTLLDFYIKLLFGFRMVAFSTPSVIETSSFGKRCRFFFFFLENFTFTIIRLRFLKKTLSDCVVTQNILYIHLQVWRRIYFGYLHISRWFS